jgi:predicted permease
VALEIRQGVGRLFHLVLRRPDAVREAMDEELQFHLDARVEQLVARGMAPEAARAEAIRRMGGSAPDVRARILDSAERKERRLAMREWLHDLRQDLHYATRGLARRKAFTLLAVVTLAVGIGANTAIFSAVNAMLLRSLPFYQPERLMDLSLTSPPDGSPTQWSFPKFAVYRDAQRSFSDLALNAEARFNLSQGEAERVDGESVTAGYLGTLGIAPALGRDFPLEEDAHGGAPRITLISDALWKRRFSADPATIGRTIDIDGEPFEVIGILPPGFKGLTGRSEVLVPITTRPQEDLTQAWSLEFSLLGRLKPGVTPAQATAEAKLLGARVYDAYPWKEGSVGNAATSGWLATAVSLDLTRVAPAVRRSLMILSGAVAFVLLIACVNLANLLLGRASERRKEIAIRLAIGASRGRLVRLLLTESLLLSLLGGAASLLVAAWGTNALRAVNPLNTLQVQGLAGLGVVSFSGIRLDGAALLFTLSVALLVGILFGLVPALHATRPVLTESLKDDGAGSGRFGRFSMGLTRHTLVVAEVALALVLLAGAGLTIRSLRHLMAVDAGFDGRNLLTARMAIERGAVPRDSLPGFYDELLARLRALPGVTQVAITDCPPLAGGCNGTILTFPDRPPTPGTEAPQIGVHWVTPGYFSTLNVPLKRGRLFVDADRLGAEKVILINETAAKRYWPNEDPIGKQAAVWQGGFHEGARIVGVVGDVRFGTIDSVAGPDAYISYAQSPRSYMLIFLKTQGDPLALGSTLRQTLHDLAPDYPVYDMATMDDRIAAATAQARFSASLLTMFAGVALALAVLGIYGVMSFAVSQRTREIGIRMALGADRVGVLGLVIREGVALAAVGGVIGLGLALALTRVLRSFLYEVRPTDPATYVAIVALLSLAALLATWIPARRAASVDPVKALRRG